MRMRTADREALCLKILTERAEHGLACPTNNELCELLGYDSPAAPARIIKQLENRRLISVERGQVTRVITVLATGDRTAGQVGQAHWRQLHPGKPRNKPHANDRNERQQRLAEMEAKPRVERDPCPRCGVRADVGCRHDRAPLGWFVGSPA